MSTIINDRLGQSPFEPVLRLLTASDLAALPNELPSGPVDFELYQGRLIPMSPTGRRHSNLQSRLASAIFIQGEQTGYGQAHTEVGVLLSRKPDTVVGPDVAFVSKRSMPIRETPEGYLETLPELVVEIRSKNDTRAYLDRKVADYLQAGVKAVWIVEPAESVVVEHRLDAAAKTLGLAETLTCDDIIPGFRLPLAELFKE